MRATGGNRCRSMCRARNRRFWLPAARSRARARDHPIAAVFLAIVWAEKVLNWTKPSRSIGWRLSCSGPCDQYCGLATHDMKVSYPVFVLGLVVFMVIDALADRYAVRDDSFAQEGSGFRRPIGSTG